jgi:REP element-mobilizing transposase RayT
MSRGDRREEIFRDDADRRRFLETLGAVCEKTGWQVHAYCLMSNHFHLVVETPRANLVEGMKWFLGTYTMRFNRRHKLSGHLFAGRYKSLLIDGSTPGYLRTVCDYVHLNPVRAGLLKKGERLQKYKWSSYPNYLRSKQKRERWLRCDRLFGEHGLTKEGRRSRLEFVRRMEQRRAEPNDASAQPIRRGWSLWCAGFCGTSARSLAWFSWRASSCARTEANRRAEGRDYYLSGAQEAWLGKKRTFCSAQERSAQGGTGERTALANHDELEMDSAALRNGLVDARLQSSSPVGLCQK